MLKFLHEIEVLVDRLIPLCLLLLPAVFIIEIYFSWIKNTYHYWFDLFDIVVIAIFLIDLFFKYERVRKMKVFLKEYWLDIIAVLPFFLIFRFLEIFRLSELMKSGEQVLHEAVVLERQSRLIVEEAEEVAKVSRTERFLRYFRVFGRFPRFCEAFSFFEHPTGKHHVGEDKKEDWSSDL